MAKVKKIPAASLALLDSPPDGKLLLIRNLFAGAVGLHALGSGDDVSIPILSEVVVPAGWARNRELVAYIQQGYVEVEWVDETYSPRGLPNLADAPFELQLDKATERQFALAIATRDDAFASAMIETMVYQPQTTEIDIPYMRQTFAKVLKLADWLEERIRNRSALRNKIKAAIRRINDL